MTSRLYPVSYAQERMWKIDAFLQDRLSTTALNIPCILEVKGGLDIRVLNRSLQEIVTKHASLRSVFTEKNNSLYQYILDDVVFNIYVEDFSNLDHITQKRKTNNIINQNIEYEFSKSQEILFRTTMIKLGQQRYVLIFLFHHIISDEWSLKVFFNDLEKTYVKHLYQEKTLPSIDRSYLEFSEWQKKWFKENKFKDQFHYWSNKLENVPNTIYFPTDNRDKGEVSSAGFYSYQFDQNLYDRLKDFSQKNNTTVFMIILAAYKTFIHIYSQSNDILVATPITNRHYKNVQNTIGCFVNLVLLRTSFDQTLTYSQLLQTVKETSLEAHDNQDMPFNLLMDQLDKSDNFEKYFPQFVFELKTLNHYVPHLPHLKINEYGKKYEKNPKYENFQKLIVLEIEYCSDLFDENTVEIFMISLIKIVEQILDQPDSLVQKTLLDNLKNKREETIQKESQKYDSGEGGNTESSKNISLDLKAIQKLNKCIKLSVKELR
ncbi:MAG: hypothetical protein K2Y08_02530 [Alphaproteobacteria bacterium]|nr:hypothetical protein [Alphaproteobacteria bacterium]MBY0501889.1 hypothetical protein [Alphaproteobacteria bacterium]